LEYQSAQVPRAICDPVGRRKIQGCRRTSRQPIFNALAP
jgi:hypothetical protein